MKSSKNTAASQNPKLMFLNLRKDRQEDLLGNPPEALWETGGALRGEYSTLNFGESPSEGRESTLSSILEANVPQKKYFLSARACEGILRRSKKRGKPLPEVLEKALLKRISEQTATDATSETCP